MWKKGLFYTAKNSWLAHYTNGLLFVKCFPNIIPDEMPHGQGETEIFIAPEGIYVELENHGRYVTLVLGDSTVYSQRWFLLNVGDKGPKELLNTVQGKMKERKCETCSF